MILTQIIPFYSAYLVFKESKQQSSYLEYLKYHLGFINRSFPAHRNCLVANPKHIKVGVNCLIGRPGVYLQGAGGIVFGDYVQLAPNVGILSANHDLYDQTKYNNKKISIGDYSWVGMNSVITAGVELGPRTIVAAGSTVTKSFPEGYCVIGGTPAKLIKKLDKKRFKPWKDKVEYYGFIRANEYNKSDT